MIRRREFLQSALLLSPLASSSLRADSPAKTASTRTFDYAALKGRAQSLAASPYVAPTKLAPEALRRLDYDQYQSIRFRRSRALWADDDLGFRLEFFHLGRGFKEPVRMVELVDGQPRDIRYRPDLFEFGKSSVETRALNTDLAFAGFRIHAATNWDADVAAFLGASYFRSVGSDTRQFGLSARGLAIDTGDDPEEFPRFVEFWFERPPKHARTLIFYALLDSPSATGAYRFALTPGAPQIVEVDSAIYPRKAIRRLGIAPLTSMYQCGENDRRMANDWRPEIHDSDGLAVLTGNGEWIWRPLTNPLNLRVNSFLDRNPRGFGLLQRDRNFEHYQDDGVFYHRRPSVWIEPKTDWGEGAIQLVELTTHDETFDNIVAFWNPSTPPQPGDELLYAYRMYWGTRMPVTPPLARAVSTRTGLGGIVGQPRKYFSWRFAVDFAGGELAAIPEKADVEAVISVSRGSVEITSARPLAPIRGFRAMFDVVPRDDLEPIDIRMFLRLNGQALTETWIYQWIPPPLDHQRMALNAAGSR
jgi:periplasmic glucans biosynthesis protein